MKKLIIPILAILFIGCDEVEKVKQTADAASALVTLEEFTTVNKVFQDVGNNSGDAVLTAESSTESKSGSTKSEGPTITVEPMDFTTFPKTTTIDYGEGILCKDGVTRKGIITVVSTNWYGQENSVHTTTFSNFYHEDLKVEGTHTATNLGLNDDENLQFSVVIEEGKITTETGANIYFNQNTTRTWVAGSDTPFNIWDDEYTLVGSQSGTSSKGVEYSLTVEEDLHFVLSPRNIKSGILDVSVGEIDNIKINYNNSTITIFDEEYDLNN